MTEINTKSSRRAFFLHGGAALGAGFAATAGAAVLKSDDALPVQEQLAQLQQQLACAKDCEAIQQLHLAFATMIESQTYETAAELFDAQAQLQLSGASAVGRPAIQQLFAEQYRQQKAALIHQAYRQGTAAVIALSADRLQATATFPVEVKLSAPLRGDSTVAKMARLQGQMASSRWEAGRFEAKYVKTQGHWKMATLNYLAS
jgi:hypothetical protein